jgi:hypothetical protein
METLRSDRSTVINLGAEGAIQVDWLVNSMGLLLRDLFASSTGPTLVGSTDAYELVLNTSQDGPSTSATVQIVRPFVDGSSQQFTYKGSVCTGWEITQELDKPLVVKAMFDAQDSDTTTAAGSANYSAADTTFFHWGDCDVTIDGGAVDFKKLSLKADYKPNTDRRFLRGSVLKKIPRVASTPEYTGELEGEFESLAHYNRFTGGDIVPAVFTWTGAQIEVGHNYSVVIDLAAIQYRGETPEASLTELPKQTVPFKVLDDGVNPAIKVTVKSTDSAL